MKTFRDYLNLIKNWKDQFVMRMSTIYHETIESASGIKGEVFIDITDLSGKLIERRHINNIPTKDVRLLVARLLKDPTEPAHGINMLAVGTGAPGPLLNPNAPDDKERKLFAEIARKSFSSVTFRDANGIAVAYATNIVDFTTIFGPGEAAGPLNEMGLVSTISSNPSIKNFNPDTFPNYTTTINVANYDILVNVINFSVITKPSQSNMSITWRITVI
jgi:hypothetical protein